jgi:hypothetical protein
MAEGSYSRRFWKRFIKDATPWARDNIIWGLLALLVPPVFIYLRSRHPQIDWPLYKTTVSFYGVALVTYILVQLCRVPAKLDAEREGVEALLRTTLVEREQTITKLTTNPPRSPAEQHHYDVAQRTLQRFGPKAEMALRFLKSQGSVNFGTYNPSFLPPGLNGHDALWAYNACAGEGVVTCRDNYPRMGERTFEVAPTMSKALDELLYPLTLYAAVRCQLKAEHVIRLAVIKKGDEQWAVEPFDAYCDECKTHQQFSRDQVIHWQGPAPSNTFQTHSSFQSSSPHLR